MAQAIACDLCQTEVAELMQTSLATGDVIAIGPSCQLTFLLTVAATIADDMPADVALSYGELIEPIVTRLARYTPLGKPLPVSDEKPETGNEDPVELAEAVNHDE
jgi:hypothetical protein